MRIHFEVATKEAGLTGNLSDLRQAMHLRLESAELMRLGFQSLSLDSLSLPMHAEACAVFVGGGRKGGRGDSGATLWKQESSKKARV